MSVNKRGWVKNTAIIFLSVLLVLTLFSNTIMNRSLPEVSAQMVRSGSINPQIRGNGAVAAEESFEVKTELSRKILSVHVKVGDIVSVDDTLILFSDADSNEMKQAQDALDDLNLAYQRALLTASSGKYSSERKALEDAQETLDAAKKIRDENVYNETDLVYAKETLNNVKLTLSVTEAARDKAQADLTALGPRDPGSAGDYSAVVSTRNALSATKLLHKDAIDAFEAAAQSGMAAHNLANPTNKVTIDVYREYLAMEYMEYKTSTLPLEIEKYNQYVAYQAVADAQAAYDAAVKAYNNSTSTGNAAQYDQLSGVLANAEANVKIAKNAVTTAEEKLAELEAKKEAYDAAVVNVTAAEKSVRTSVLSLEQAVALENLNFADQKKDIDAAAAHLASLKAGGESSIVKSNVNGVVTAVNVSSGDTSTPNTALIVVEVPDRGYTVSYSVTKEQSQKVRVGDPAEVLYRYWGPEITAKLVAIKTDPTNPSTHKLLVFSISGEVQSGETLDIAIGERGSNYDAVVPNSAIREDSNGKFVLMVQVKASALGNRFTAARVDIQVLASDDTNSAVSGGLTGGDYVITNSSAPLEPGMLVRLPDNL